MESIEVDILMGESGKSLKESISKSAGIKREDEGKSYTRN
jgi:hypothetical protein